MCVYTCVVKRLSNKYRLTLGTMTPSFLTSSLVPKISVANKSTSFRTGVNIKHKVIHVRNNSNFLVITPH